MSANASQIAHGRFRVDDVNVAVSAKRNRDSSDFVCIISTGRMKSVSKTLFECGPLNSRRTRFSRRITDYKCNFWAWRVHDAVKYSSPRRIFTRDRNAFNSSWVINKHRKTGWRITRSAARLFKYPKKRPIGKQLLISSTWNYKHYNYIRYILYEYSCNSHTDIMHCR